uniref:LRAT domain-containing protein n=1 Tax=Salmo trutta TaxID=8032 RepID=A0A674B1A2_SALTR
MKRMKQTFILAILLFQLTISVEGGFHFGDIIKFDRTGYNHYAIWVGDKVFDIFHFPVTKCTFASLAAVKGRSNPVVDNHLDDILTLTIDCGRYFVIKNNCEHIATTICYGEAVCLQVLFIIIKHDQEFCFLSFLLKWIKGL